MLKMAKPERHLDEYSHSIAQLMHRMNCIEAQVENFLGTNSANVWAKGIVGATQGSHLNSIILEKKVDEMVNAIFPKKLNLESRRLKASPVTSKVLYSPRKQGAGNVNRLVTSVDKSASISFDKSISEETESQAVAMNRPSILNTIQFQKNQVDHYQTIYGVTHSDSKKQNSSFYSIKHDPLLVMDKPVKIKKPQSNAIKERDHANGPRHDFTPKSECPTIEEEMKQWPTSHSRRAEPEHMYFENVPTTDNTGTDNTQNYISIKPGPMKDAGV